MKKRTNALRYFLTALVSVVLTLAIVAGALLGISGGPENFARAAKLAQVLHLIDTEFVQEADLDKATDAAASSMIDSLDDRWSFYMTEKDYSAYNLRTKNSYRGIGVTIAPCDEGFLIADVTRDTPAYEAGVLPAEKLVAIDGQSLKGWETTQIQEKIQSYDGETFTVDVMGTDGAVRSVTLSTVTVYSSPVSYELLDDDIGYIILKNFSTGCAEDAIEATNDLIQQGAKSLVFDVRYNGGGYVHELTDLLDYLLPEGDVFVSRDRQGNEEIITSDASCVDLPMAVLMNDSSYSAAELFAAQLSEYGVATTVGEATTGKGRSQVNYILMDDSAIHISHEAYLTSQRRDLAAEGGIGPDIAVKLSDEDKNLLYYKLLPYDEDLQLQAALEAVSHGT